MDDPQAVVAEKLERLMTPKVMDEMFNAFCLYGRNFSVEPTYNPDEPLRFIPPDELKSETGNRLARRRKRAIKGRGAR